MLPKVVPLKVTTPFSGLDRGSHSVAAYIIIMIPSVYIFGECEYSGLQ